MDYNKDHVMYGLVMQKQIYNCHNYLFIFHLNY